jgi:serine/threonine protein kinase
MGVVYEATQLSLNRVVALKVVAPNISEDVAFQKRFQREGELQSRLSHPHIVPVHEAGRTDEVLYLSMMLIRGPTLKDLIVARELDAGRALRLLGPIADAIDAAHAAGMVHRDLKPQNILVGRRDHAYLSDFGLTQTTGESSLTATGAFVGTYDYVSPEQISGERASPRSDVYSFAGVLYEALTGIVPYPKPSRTAVLFAHVADPPPRVTDCRPELPGELDRVIERGMAKQPADRYASAGNLIAEAQRAFGRRLSAVTRPPGPAESPEEIGVREAEAKIPTARTRALSKSSLLAAEKGAAPSAVPSVSKLPSGSKDLNGPASATAARQHRAATLAGLRRARLGRRRQVAILGAVVILVAVGGALLGANRQRTVASPSLRAISAGHLQAVVPPGWREAATSESVGSLQFRTARSLSPDSPEDTEKIFLGEVTASGSSLLPASFLKRLSVRPRAQVVQLRAGEALRYASLPENTDGVRRVYLVPTSAGVATVACTSKVQPTSGLQGACDFVAMRLAVRGVHVFPVGSDPAYARAVSQALATLKRDRARRTRDLVAARGARMQALASSRIAAAYSRSTQTLASTAVKIPPQVKPVHSELVASLRRASGAYTSMSRAAKHRNRRAYSHAASLATQAESRVRNAVRALTTAGYSIK